jgi:glycosyltransferase involved in cell wall biosynthesis
MHVHNTLPLLSPAILRAARGEGTAVVQTAHNYRLLCPAATLFRNDRLCEACRGRTVAWPAILHGCYRGSRSASAVVAAMLAVHWTAGTWSRDVDRYIALTEFARRKLVAGGLPPSRIAVKPNFTSPPVVANRTGDRAGALFVGRLSVEKGIDTLLEAWTSECGPLRVIGGGPLLDRVKGRCRPGVEVLGPRASSEIAAWMLHASFLVVPSRWFEGFPMVLVEAFACGLPVIASRLGSIGEIVEDGVTGVLFDPGSARDLLEKVRWARVHPEDVRRMGENARRAYEARYTPQANYDALMEIYRAAIDNRRSVEAA